MAARLFAIAALAGVTGLLPPKELATPGEKL
jgi:hypothetical protein